LKGRELTENPEYSENLVEAKEKQDFHENSLKNPEILTNQDILSQTPDFEDNNSYLAMGKDENCKDEEKIFETLKNATIEETEKEKSRIPKSCFGKRQSLDKKEKLAHNDKKSMPINEKKSLSFEKKQSIEKNRGIVDFNEGKKEEIISKSMENEKILLEKNEMILIEERKAIESR